MTTPMSDMTASRQSSTLPDLWAAGHVTIGRLDVWSLSAPRRRLTLALRAGLRAFRVGTRARTAGEPIRGEDTLRGALGAAAVGPCTFDFSSALASVESFVKTAQILENTGVMAYDGAIRYVDAGDTLQAGAQIATVEARSSTRAGRGLWSAPESRRKRAGVRVTSRL